MSMCASPTILVVVFPYISRNVSIYESESAGRQSMNEPIKKIMLCLQVNRQMRIRATLKILFDF